METKETFLIKSYRQHSEEFKEYAKTGIKACHARTWLQGDTVDAWRHQRMYRVLDPILYSEPHAKWLTVGDGRYGKDAEYITSKGCDALATDISEYLLKEAKEVGFIKKYRVENAESLSFEDSVFDYVLCKESYHHFPRPMRALYEMLRVARSGVVLIEPNDRYINDKCSNLLFKSIFDMASYILRKPASRHSFEESGNYVFSISRRELEKVALGLNYKMLAVKGINDSYVSGVEYEKMADRGPLQRKLRMNILVSDVLSTMGISAYCLLAAIIFKKIPSRELVQKLVDEGFKIIGLPDNPYISS